MAACDFCTGTHYLSDMPDLGPCVCCTPEAMQRRDRTIKELTAPPPPPGPVEALDLAEANINTAREAFAKLETFSDEYRADVRAAFADYLVSIGMDAAPVTFESPALAALAARIEEEPE